MTEHAFTQVTLLPSLAEWSCTKLFYCYRYLRYDLLPGPVIRPVVVQRCTPYLFIYIKRTLAKISNGSNCKKRLTAPPAHQRCTVQHRDLTIRLSRMPSANHAVVDHLRDHLFAGHILTSHDMGPDQSATEMYPFVERFTHSHCNLEWQISSSHTSIPKAVDSIEKAQA